MSMETKVLPCLPSQLWEERFDFFLCSSCFISSLIEKLRGIWMLELK